MSFVYCIFFSTLHITGKYKGLFSREYREFNSALYINILSCVVVAWHSPMSCAHRAQFSMGGGGKKVQFKMFDYML